MGLVHSFEWTLVFRLGSSSCESSCELGFMRFRVSGVALSSSCECLDWFGVSTMIAFGIPVAALEGSVLSPQWRTFHMAASSRREGEVAREHSIVFRVSPTMDVVVLVAHLACLRRSPILILFVIAIGFRHVTILL